MRKTTHQGKLHNGQTDARLRKNEVDKYKDVQTKSFLAGKI